MNLTTKRLSIQEICKEDLDFIHHLHSIPQVDEFNTLGIPKDKQATIQLLDPVFNNQRQAERRQYAWIIRDNQNLSSLGICGMTLTADRFKMAEIYYNLHPDHWGQGYATEAAFALLEFGFTKCGLHRIEAGTAVGNKRSTWVLQKIGMTREGIRKKILPIRGSWVDGYQYAILEDEYKRTGGQ